MTFAEFCDRLATIFGHKTRLDFSLEERLKLEDLYTDLFEDAYDEGHNDAMQQVDDERAIRYGSCI